ncbi:MAG: PIN domain nuclease [Dehalococcoidia bacterium]
MIIVDSSVWIDYFTGKESEQTNLLDSSLDKIPIVIGDLIMTEVLQGFQSDRDCETAKEMLLQLPFMAMGGLELSLKGAMNYRHLKRKGVTVRKTIDVMIGTFCIHHQIPLLHDDKDFEPMVKFLGLKIFGT